MKIIKVSSGRSEQSELLLRQTSEGRGVWGDCQFVVNQKVDRCDWWVVLHSSGLRDSDSVCCDPNHLVYISMEPFEIGSKAFLDQFSKLVLCDRNIHHKNITYFNGTTWWVGINVRHEGAHYFDDRVNMNYDMLKQTYLPVKNKEISIVTSNRRIIPGHSTRLAFIEKLMAHPISRYIDIYGGGFKPIADKWDVISPYKYHLVLENTVLKDYWTEKIGDAFLGYSLPIYFGCPNIHDYFEPQSIKTIDINKFDDTIKTIESLLSTNSYQEHYDAICRARNKVLDKYNIFAFMAAICDVPATKFSKCVLHPPSLVGRHWVKRVARKMIYRMKKIDL